MQVSTIYTLWQMCAMHEINGRRFNRYHELGQFAFGRKLGLWLVIPCQLIVMIGLDIVYCVTGGKAMKFVYSHTCSQPCPSFGLRCAVVIRVPSDSILVHVLTHFAQYLFCCLKHGQQLPATIGTPVHPHAIAQHALQAKDALSWNKDAFW